MLTDDPANCSEMVAEVLPDLLKAMRPGLVCCPNPIVANFVLPA